jgi:hypothetical protein
VFSGSSKRMGKIGAVASNLAAAGELQPDLSRVVTEFDRSVGPFPPNGGVFYRRGLTKSAPEIHPPVGILYCI